MTTVSALIYACNVAGYDAAFENLQQCNCFEFLTYFTENWHNCKTLWCLAFRRDLLTLRNNTNNRIENFNHQLKYVLTPNLYLSEALVRLVNSNYAVSSDIGYRHKRELGMRVDARCNTLPNLFNVTLTNTALVLLTTQCMKFETMKHSVTETEVSMDSFDVK